MNDTTPMDAMQIESRLEKHCDRSSATEEFASVTRHLPTIDGIEIDSVQHGVYRIWIGSVLIGIVRRDGVFWAACDGNSKPSCWERFHSVDHARDKIIQDYFCFTADRLKNRA